MIMDWLLIFIFIGLFVLGYLVALICTFASTAGIKRENERLNAKLKELTDRDSRGRFVGNKK
jgi:uncharacterized integral membrane protein